MQVSRYYKRYKITAEFDVSNRYMGGMLTQRFSNARVEVADADGVIVAEKHLDAPMSEREILAVGEEIVDQIVSRQPVGAQ